LQLGTGGSPSAPDPAPPVLEPVLTLPGQTPGLNLPGSVVLPQLPLVPSMPAPGAF